MGCIVCETCRIGEDYHIEAKTVQCEMCGYAMSLESDVTYLGWENDLHVFNLWRTIKCPVCSNKIRRGYVSCKIGNVNIAEEFEKLPIRTKMGDW